MSEREIDQEYAEEVIREAIEWVMSSAPEWFDDGFIQSVYDQFEQGRKISARQVAALENILEKFSIN